MKLLWIGVDPAAADPKIRTRLNTVAIATELSVEQAVRRMTGEDFDIVLLSAAALGCTDEQALQTLLHDNPSRPVILHHSDGTIDDAIRLTRQGAFYVLLGDIDPQRLEYAVNTAADKVRSLRPDFQNSPWRRLLIGRSRPIVQICEVIQLVASKRCTILITGETGTGKEVVARAIHAASNRSNLPMVAVNCTALPANLIESELFGHAKGAFTGAHMSRTGRFEQANRSTIFLDEIGDLPLDAQAKLLRVLQEQEFQRVGSSETVRVDVRVVAASNVDLEEAIRDRRFREDLYYRLNVVPIHIPALRERREDIPLLVDHFLEKIRQAESAPPKRISPEAVQLLMSLDWPGNVRQLEHTLQMAFALSGDRNVLYPGDFSSRRGFRPSASPVAQHPLITVPEHGLNFDEVVSQFELSLLNQALAASGGNKARAADLLQIKRTTLLAKMKTLDERNAPRSMPRLVDSQPAACQPLDTAAGV